MKHSLRYILILSVSLFYTYTSNAQVTIGSETKSNAGALLDLKQYNDPEAINGGRNADKGLIMPRIQLKQLNTLSDIGLNASSNESHMGLVVYNTNECLDYGMTDTKGIYVWDGDEWKKVGKKELAPSVHEYVDNRDPANPQVYLYAEFGDAGTWMLENMRATKYEQGGSDVEIGIITTPGAPYNLKRYIYPGPASGGGTNDTYYKRLPAMGFLYSWAAATNNENLPTQALLEQGQIAGDTPGPNEVETVVPGGKVQGICPNGWHLPSDREWNMLEEEIADNPTKYSTNTGTSWNDSWNTTYNERGTHGANLRTPCLPPGMQIYAKGKSLPASQGGFNLYLTGFGYSFNGQVMNYGSYAYFRTSSSSADSGNNNDKSAWHRSLGNDMVGVNRINSFRNNMMSVRCKKD